MRWMSKRQNSDNDHDGWLRVSDWMEVRWNETVEKRRVTAALALFFAWHLRQCSMNSEAFIAVLQLQQHVKRAFNHVKMRTLFFFSSPCCTTLTTFHRRLTSHPGVVVEMFTVHRHIYSEKMRQQSSSERTKRGNSSFHNEIEMNITMMPATHRRRDGKSAGKWFLLFFRKQWEKKVLLPERQPTGNNDDDVWYARGQSQLKNVGWIYFSFPRRLTRLIVISLHISTTQHCVACELFSVCQADQRQTIEIGGYFHLIKYWQCK